MTGSRALGGASVGLLLLAAAVWWVQPGAPDADPAPTQPVGRTPAKVKRSVEPAGSVVAAPPAADVPPVDAAFAHAASALGATATRCPLGVELPAGAGPAALPHHRDGDVLHVLVAAPSGLVPVFEGEDPTSTPIALLRWGPEPGTCAVDPVTLSAFSTTVTGPDGEPVPPDVAIEVEGDCHGVVVEGAQLRGTAIDEIACQVVVRVPELGLAGPAGWVPGQGFSNAATLQEVGASGKLTGAEIQAMNAAQLLEKAEGPTRLADAARTDGLPADVAAVLQALSDQADERAAREIDAIEAAFDLAPTQTPR